jgi:hypothetical protein
MAQVVDRCGHAHVKRPHLLERRSDRDEPTHCSLVAPISSAPFRSVYRSLYRSSAYPRLADCPPIGHASRPALDTPPWLPGFCPISTDRTEWVRRMLLRQRPDQHVLLAT